MSPLRIIFAGSGEFGIPTLRWLAEQSGHDVVQVVSQPDRPAGRGRKLTANPIAQFALDRSLSLVRTAHINTHTLPPADLMIVIAFGQKIAERQVQHARLGSINLHASLLPKCRGAAPINWTILRGETVTGNSIIRLADRMDAGAILAQSRVPIGELETAGELHDRLAEDGAILMADLLPRLTSGQAVERLQDESEATLAPKLSRESTRIDWTRPAGEIARQIRGLYPWPGCRVRLVDAEQVEVSRLTLVRARPTANADNERQRWNAGEIMSCGAIMTPTGGVEIIELQPEGKRPMFMPDFRNGHRWQPGLRVESIV